MLLEYLHNTIFKEKQQNAQKAEITEKKQKRWQF
jgi:hypothetical protein